MNRRRKVRITALAILLALALLVVFDPSAGVSNRRILMPANVLTYDQLANTLSDMENELLNVQAQLNQFIQASKQAFEQFNTVIRSCNPQVPRPTEEWGLIDVPSIKKDLLTQLFDIIKKLAQSAVDLKTAFGSVCKHQMSFYIYAERVKLANPQILLRAINCKEQVNKLQQEVDQSTLRLIKLKSYLEERTAEHYILGADEEINFIETAERRFIDGELRVSEEQRRHYQRSNREIKGRCARMQEAIEGEVANSQAQIQRLPDNKQHGKLHRNYLLTRLALVRQRIIQILQQQLQCIRIRCPGYQAMLRLVESYRSAIKQVKSDLVLYNSPLQTKISKSKWSIFSSILYEKAMGIEPDQNIKEQVKQRQPFPLGYVSYAEIILQQQIIPKIHLRRPVQWGKNKSKRLKLNNKNRNQAQEEKSIKQREKRQEGQEEKSLIPTKKIKKYLLLPEDDVPVMISLPKTPNELLENQEQEEEELYDVEIDP